MSSTLPIHAWFDVAANGGTEHRVTLENLPANLGAPRFTIFWRAEGIPDLPLPPVLDSYVCGLALIAAKADRDLVVHGPMSRVGLYNLGQLLAARHELMPERFPRAATVTPDSVIDITRPAGDPGLAAVALSGGLDSTYTLASLTAREHGEATYRAAAVVIVHGFDAPLHQPDRFALMKARAAPAAKRAGLPLHTVVTNVKDLGQAGWPQSAIPLAANALAMFSNQCAFGIVSGGAPYDSARLGITHPPVLDALASNGWFTVVTHGASLGRSDKAEFLLRFPELIDGLKVCWEGPDPATNCGACEKCIRTRLNLLAAGVRNPKCFDCPLDLALIRKLNWCDVRDAREFTGMCFNELQRRGITGPEVDILRRRLAHPPPTPNVNDLIAWARRRIIGFGTKSRSIIPRPARRAMRLFLPPVIRP